MLSCAKSQEAEYVSGSQIIEYLLFNIGFHQTDKTRQSSNNASQPCVSPKRSELTKAYCLARVRASFPLERDSKILLTSATSIEGPWKDVKALEVTARQFPPPPMTLSSRL